MLQNIKVRYFLIAAISTATTFAITLYAADQLSKSWTIPARAYNKLSQFARVNFGSTIAEEQTIRANRLKLRVETVNIPAEDYGGGLTSIDKENALLVDRRGMFFAVNSKGYIKTNITSPDNGFNYLKSKITESSFKEHNVDFKNFRYNDIELLRRVGKQTLLLSYTEWLPKDRCFTSTLARHDFPSTQDIASLVVGQNDWKIVKRTSPCLPLQKRPLEGMKGQEAAGRIVALADKSHIIWSVGQYERGDSFAGYNYAQALGLRDGSEYGRLLEVDIDTGETSEIARGLRNPQGVAISSDGQIWVTDHGQDGGDELNRAAYGTNFGYPAVDVTP